MFEDFNIKEIRDWLYEVDCDLNELLCKKGAINLYERVAIRVILENMIAACKAIEAKSNEIPF